MIEIKTSSLLLATVKKSTSKHDNVARQMLMYSVKWIYGYHVGLAIFPNQII